MDNNLISGFADEISLNFDVQLATVRALGMSYISLRSADGKNIADYTPQEAEEKLWPRLKSNGIGVSSLGSPIGKIGICDEDGFARQLKQLENLCEICKLFSCRYIRIFSFYMPKGEEPESYREAVVEKFGRFLEIARRHGVILLHENEKEIYGDTAKRCLKLFEAIDAPDFRAAFDFANFVQCGEDTVAAWNMLSPYISYIHIKDAVSGTNKNVLFGTGDGHVAELLRKADSMGYHGFLTLEPHLVIFDSLQSLEQKEAGDVIKQDMAKDGADGYRMQYEALKKILAEVHNN